jgi:tetratricopeptide (TPR) repeat protein
MDEATSAFDNAISRDKGYIDAYVGKARVNIYKREWALAIKDLEQAEKLVPRVKGSGWEKVLAQVLSLEGEARYHNNQIKEAISAYKDSLDLDEKDADTHYRLGVAYYDSDGREREAIGELTRALKAAPDGSEWVDDAYLKLGYAYRARNDKAGQCEAFHRYLDIAPVTAPKRGDVAELIQSCP